MPEIDELWDFLNTDEDAGVDPSLVEFEGFASGFIAPWRAAVMHALGDENDYAVEELGYTLRRKAGSWGWFYYFDDRQVAVAAKQQLGKEFDPNAEWCYWCTTADVLNFASEETRAKFGDDLFYSGRATGIGSRKYGPELHQVMLPAAVAAVATARGIDNPGFDLSPLHDLDGDSDEDECHRLVGGGDVKLDDAVLWQQRAELWAALSEPDPRKSQMIGGGKHATGSKAPRRGQRQHRQSPVPAGPGGPVPEPGSRAGGGRRPGRGRRDDRRRRSASYTDRMGSFAWRLQGDGPGSEGSGRQLACFQEGRWRRSVRLHLR
jgi:hypothetical protein